jgi:CheY-like chemotaxis protein
LEAGDYVRITVTDTGAGISPEVQARAFEPFFSTKGTGGSGLGLAQVNGTVRQAGGAVRIRSEPGHGTQVTLLLPRSAANAEPVAGPLQAERPTPQMAPLVLLVDDDTAVRNVTSDMLKDLGCSVLEAEGGREALDLIERRRDDVTLAVVDYAMPEMNGVQLARAIRDRGIGAPIVLATGYAELAEPLDSRSSPLSIVLRKPFTINQLQTTITRLHRPA